MTQFSQFNHANSKLTGAQVIEIRQKYAARTYTQDALSREYGVSINTIRNIVRGVTWQNLPMVKSEAEEATELALSQQRFAALMRMEEQIAKAAEPQRIESEMDQFINPDAKRRFLGEKADEQSTSGSDSSRSGQEEGEDGQGKG